MPQLDPTFFISQLFWLAVTFALLYAFMLRFALPRITGVLQNRRERIATDLEKAERMKKDAEKLNAEYLTSIGAVRAQANATISEAIAKAKDESDRRHAALDAELHDRFRKTEADLAQTRKETLRNTQDVAVELAVFIVKKLTDISIKEDRARKSVQAVMGENT